MVFSTRELLPSIASLRCLRSLSLHSHWSAFSAAQLAALAPLAALTSLTITGVHITPSLFYPHFHGIRPHAIGRGASVFRSPPCCPLCHVALGPLVSLATPQQLPLTSMRGLHARRRWLHWGGPPV